MSAGPPSLRLGKPSSGFDGFALFSHRGFLIGPAQFQFLKQATLGKLVFENLYGLVDIVINDLDLQNFTPFLFFIFHFHILITRRVFVYKSI